MRNTLLIIKREYLERVRTRAFIIFTLAIPLFMYGVIVLPSKLMMRKPGGSRTVVVVSADQTLGNDVVKQLSGAAKQEKSAAGDDEDRDIGPKYTATLVTDTSNASRDQLLARVGDSGIDGVAWLTDETSTSRNFTYYTRNASDFADVESVRGAVRSALTHIQLAKSGLSEEAADDAMRRVSVETLRVEKGKVSKTNGILAFLFPLMLMMMLYMTVILYGVSVMRSVIEEKTSRVIEVLLSSLAPKELMAGKILGVGAVGLTQMALWGVVSLVVSSPALMAMKGSGISVPLPVVLTFPVFFVLGYLLYSSMYAAIGAMVNSDEEGQQMQTIVVLPLIACAVFASMVIRTPNSPLAVGLSIFPLTSPIIMFLRIAVQMPPAWQIAVSIALLVATIYGIVALCSRIYRVGILMYGKRPTLPEILKWIKYA